MSETLELTTAFIDGVPKRLEDALKALNVRPALDPYEARLSLEKPDGRHQIYVPADSEPRDLTDEDIGALAKRIAKLSLSPTFYRLQLPEGVTVAARLETRSVSCRYIRFYHIVWDKHGDRLDVLFDA